MTRGKFLTRSVALYERDQKVPITLILLDNLDHGQPLPEPSLLEGLFPHVPALVGEDRYECKQDNLDIVEERGLLHDQHIRQILVVKARGRHGQGKIHAKIEEKKKQPKKENRFQRKMREMMEQAEAQKKLQEKILRIRWQINSHIT